MQCVGLSMIAQKTQGDRMISAFVICQNEELTIERCLRSLSFSSDIVVVDGGSTDSTVERIEQLITEGLPIRCFRRSWTGFSEQKNYALSLCRGPWVFSLDADEAATHGLALKVEKIVAESTSSPEITCFRVRREEFFLGEHLPGGPGCPSFQERLFLKEAVEYRGNIHEYPHLRFGRHGLIQEAILHSPLLDFEGVLRRMNTYTTLEARDRFSRGQRTSLAHAFLTFFSSFLRNYLVYGGFRGGKAGALWCFIESISRTMRHLKLWALQNRVREKALKVMAAETKT